MGDRGFICPTLQMGYRGLSMFQTERERAIWLACAIDSEGYINIAKKPYDAEHGHRLVKVGIANTNKDFVELFISLVNEKAQPSCRERPPNKPLWVWCVSGLSALNLLKRAEPFLTVKKAKAREAITHLENSDILTRSEQFSLRFRSPERLAQAWKTRRERMGVCGVCGMSHYKNSKLGRLHSKGGDNYGR